MNFYVFVYGGTIGPSYREDYFDGGKEALDQCRRYNQMTGDHYTCYMVSMDKDVSLWGYSIEHPMLREVREVTFGQHGYAGMFSDELGRLLRKYSASIKFNHKENKIMIDAYGEGSLGPRGAHHIQSIELVEEAILQEIDLAPNVQKGVS